MVLGFYLSSTTGVDAGGSCQNFLLSCSYLSSSREVVTFLDADLAARYSRIGRPGLVVLQCVHNFRRDRAAYDDWCNSLWDSCQYAASRLRQMAKFTLRQTPSMRSE